MTITEKSNQFKKFLLDLEKTDFYFKDGCLFDEFLPMQRDCICEVKSFELEDYYDILEDWVAKGGGRSQFRANI